MALVITGISQDGQTDRLEVALRAAGLALDPIQVIGPEESVENVASGIIGADLLVDDQSTGVPGLTGGNAGMRFFRNESLADRLGDLEIPDSEMDNYLEALERGRSVVAYFARADNIEAIDKIFRETGLANVRRF
ncbi:MAG: hypothetical protein ACREM8_02450 [Vulcanimicrobiaceae bacterium]